MVRLMNSAMMPQEGRYTLSSLSESVFAAEVRAASLSGRLRSYIGYPQTANYVSYISGVEIPTSRSMTTLDDGDRMLIIKLKYRTEDPASKGQPVDPDFDFFGADYEVSP